MYALIRTKDATQAQWRTEHDTFDAAAAICAWNLADNLGMPRLRAQALADSLELDVPLEVSGYTYMIRRA